MCPVSVGGRSEDMPYLRLSDGPLDGPAAARRGCRRWPNHCTRKLTSSQHRHPRKVGWMLQVTFTRRHLGVGRICTNANGEYISLLR